MEVKTQNVVTLFEDIITVELTNNNSYKFSKEDVDVDYNEDEIDIVTLEGGEDILRLPSYNTVIIDNELLERFRID